MLIDEYATILELCDLCGEPLDADNCYGSEEMPLCKYHHEKLEKTLMYLFGAEIEQALGGEVRK